MYGHLLTFDPEVETLIERDCKIITRQLSDPDGTLRSISLPQYLWDYQDRASMVQKASGRETLYRLYFKYRAELLAIYGGSDSLAYQVYLYTVIRFRPGDKKPYPECRPYAKTGQSTGGREDVA